MKKTLYPLLLLPLLLSWLSLQASHEMGAQVTYSCINACTTRVYFKGYRDCTGLNSISNNLTWYSPPGCMAPPALGAWSTATAVEVTPVCPGAPTGCTVPGAPINGVEEIESYRDYDICAGSPCTYNLRWGDCCRNPSITSLSSAFTQSMALNDITLNTALGTCNSSPVYTNYPLFYVCQGQNYYVHQGAVDPDGDSLAYTMAACYQNTSTQVIYAPGFSATAPLGGSWTVTLDATSGLMHLVANPGNAVVGVICITVQEFRNGQPIGVTQRDIQVTTVNCPSNSNPTLGALTNVTSTATVNAYHVWADPGVPLCMDIATADANAGQNVRLFWSNLDATTATFASASNGAILDTIPGTGANPPVGRLCWANPVYGTYHFKVRVEDNNCPIYGYSERFIVVHINNCSSGTNVTITPLGCPGVAFLASSCMMGLVNYQWTGSGGFTSNLPNPIYYYPSAGNQTYQLVATNGSQADTVSGSFFVGGGMPVHNNNILVGPYNLSICGGTTTDTLDAGPGSNYIWSQNATTQQIVVVQPGVYYVTMTNIAGCDEWDSTEVSYTAPDIEGYVTTSTGAALQNQKILLIQHDTTTQSLWAVDSAMTDILGYYYFCNVTDTLVFLKATPLAADYPNEMPTYADTTLFWNNAVAFTGVLQTPFSYDFSTLFGANPGGPGFIGGLITQGANKMSAVGDPVPDLRVALIDHMSGDILGTTLTDVNGYFSFSNIPLGDYEIVPDRPLVSTTNVPLVSLTAQVPVQDSLYFQLHHYWLELVNSTVAVPSPLPGLSFTASPNPFDKSTYISLHLPADADVSLDVYDVVGKCVAHLAAGPLAADQYRYAIGDELRSGIYFVRLKVNGGQQVIKILKSN
jgi:hypothetical protein